MRETVQLTPYTAGPDAFHALPGMLKGKKPALIGGHTAMAAALPRLKEALSQGGMALETVLPFAGHPTMAAAQQLAEQVRASGADVLLGLGGGRALDIAKAVGHLLDMPVYTLPTIAATCAAVSALSVLYRPDGSLETLLQLREAPVHCALDTAVIAASPTKYLRAGLGDTLAKHVEVPFSARGRALRHCDALGLSIALGLYPALLAHAVPALEENSRQEAGPHLTAAALQSVVDVGYVSTLVDEQYNVALAHSLYYALEPLKQMANLLHGDVVAWGVLVQLTLDGQRERAQEVRRLLKAVGTPLSLESMGLPPSDPAVLACLRAAAHQPDMATLPYPIPPEAIVQAVARCEEDTACSPT